MAAVSSVVWWRALGIPDDTSSRVAERGSRNFLSPKEAISAYGDC